MCFTGHGHYMPWGQRWIDNLNQKAINIIRFINFYHIIVFIGYEIDLMCSNTEEVIVDTSQLISIALSSKQGQAILSDKPEEVTVSI